MRLSGSVKLRCALGSGSSDGGAAGLPGFLRPSALRCCSFSASMRRSSSAASLASASGAGALLPSQFGSAPEVDALNPGHRQIIEATLICLVVEDRK